MENSVHFGKMEMNEIQRLYFVMLYLKDFLPRFAPEFVQEIQHQFLRESNRSLHAISFLHTDVIQYLKKLNINFNSEEKLFGLAIDVVLYSKEGEEMVGAIEIHGYQHFLRNVEEMTGDSWLKHKLLTLMLGDMYFEIELVNWDLLAPGQSRLEFLTQLLKPYLDKYYPSANSEAQSTLN